MGHFFPLHSLPRDLFIQLMKSGSESLWSQDGISLHIEGYQLTSSSRDFTSLFNLVLCVKKQTKEKPRKNHSRLTSQTTHFGFSTNQI